jgi:hypothetical protein
MVRNELKMKQKPIAGGGVADYSPFIYLNSLKQLNAFFGKKKFSKLLLPLPPQF